VHDFQEETERERCIPKPLVQGLCEAGLYRMLVPRVLGGAELDIHLWGGCCSASTQVHDSWSSDSCPTAACRI
jgi:hypothetical protein